MSVPFELLNAYASAVRALFAPPPLPGEDRGYAGPVSAEEIEARAEKILNLSADLTRAEREQLEDADPLQRAQSAQRLLAKAATEFEISAYLKEAGQDESDRVPLTPQRLNDRSVRTGAQVEGYLDVLTGKVQDSASQERAAAVPASLTSARQQLSTSAKDACDLIAVRAGDTAKAAFSGVLGVGLTEIAQAAGTIASVVAGSFGAAEGLSKLYTLCRDFIAKAYDSLLSLIGDELAKLIGDKAVEWIKEVKDVHLFGDWLKNAYKVATIQSDLQTRIQGSSNREPARFAEAIDDVGSLLKRFGREMDLTKKLIRGLGYLRFVPGLAGPQGLLLRAGAYSLLLVWVVFDGADYLDSPGLQLLTRVPGVPAVVATKIL
jgi:hypothetical protein